MRRITVVAIFILIAVPCAAQWKDAGFSGVGANVLAIGVHDTNVFVADSAFANSLHLVYRYESWLNDWTGADNGIDASQGNVTSFASLGKYLFAGQGNGPANETTDNGLQWNATGTASPVATNGMFLFAQYVVPSQIIRSTDSGKSWEVKANYSVNSYASIGTYIFATIGNGVIRSTDTGNSWSQIRPPVLGPMTAMDSILYIVGKGELAKTTDSGETWSMVTVDSAGVAWPVNVLAMDGKNLFAGTTHGLLVSTDTGRTWQARNDGFLDVYHNNTISVTALGVFDSLLFADVTSHYVDNYYTLYDRPISELTGTANVTQISLPQDTLEVFPNPSTGGFRYLPAARAFLVFAC